MEPEHWKPVVGFEDRYEVSSWGNVRSLPRVVRQRGRYGEIERTIGGRPMTAHLSKGYPRLSLRDGSEKCNLRNVHRLVAEAFLGPAPFKGAQVAHGDGDPGNPYVGNLRWATAQENSDDRAGHGTLLKGQRNPKAVLSDEDVLDIRQRYTKARGQLTELAKEYGVTPTSIQFAIQRKTFKHI